MAMVTGGLAVLALLFLDYAGRFGCARAGDIERRRDSGRWRWVMAT